VIENFVNMDMNLMKRIHTLKKPIKEIKENAGNVIKLIWQSLEKDILTILKTFINIKWK
jgi:hypothetical protein